MKFQDLGMNQSVFHGSCHVRVLLSLLKVLLTGQFIGGFHSIYNDRSRGPPLCVFFEEISRAPCPTVPSYLSMSGTPSEFFAWKRRWFEGQCWHIFFASQIIATSHDLTPNGGLVREIPTAPTSGVKIGRKGNPLISGKSRLVKYYNLARYVCVIWNFTSNVYGLFKHTRIFHRVVEVFGSQTGILQGFWKHPLLPLWESLGHFKCTLWTNEMYLMGSSHDLDTWLITMVNKSPK